jgi:hypothetical protein
MPSTSKKQHNFMNAVAHSPEFAKKAGVPQSVGKDFSNADKSRTFSKGGDMKESKAMAAKEMNFMKKKGAPKSMIKHEMAEAKGKPFAKGGSVGTTKMGSVKTSPGNINGVASKGKTKGTMVKMMRGGKTC